MIKIIVSSDLFRRPCITKRQKWLDSIGMFMPNTSDYTIFKDFIEKYHPQRFEHISRLDPFMIAMEAALRNNNQFFYIADLLNIKIIFTSWGSQKIIGISPEQVDPSTFFPRAHPDDQERLNRAQTKLYKMGQGLFIDRKGIYIVSIQLREQNCEGDYINFFLQTYSFFSEAHHTVFTVLVATDLSALKFSKDYYYAGNDPFLFRYPDETLLNDNHRFSHREVEVLRLIALGLGSEQIADKLFLSVNTVDTHRRNILKKTKKSSTHELLIELQENGVL